MLYKKTHTYFLITLLFILLFIQLNFAQKEANHWYFGSAAGLDFTSGVPLPDASASTATHFTAEGAVSMSDAAGNLLFYYADKTIWNKNHVIMPNGNGINGSNSTSQALAVLKPGSTTIYYLFVIDISVAVNGALSYSEIDMSLNGGLGDVTATKNSLLYNKSCEKVTAIKHCNQQDIWIITHDYTSDAFRTFLVTAAGVNPTPVISNVGYFFPQAYPSIGYLKGTPNGKKLASAITSYRFELFDFDNTTGVISNGATFPYISASSGPYGIEFSPDGTKMYGSTISPGKFFQYNMCAGSNTDIANSGIQIADVSGLNLYGGALQLGPDGKIYCGHQYTLGLNKSISVINNPNNLGAACNFVPQAVSLGTRDCYIGLPSFPSYYFKESVDTFKVTTSTTVNCLNASFDALAESCFTNTVDSVVWNFNDIPSGNNNRATSTTPSHLFTSAGTYNVQLIIYYPCTSDTVQQNVTVANCLCTASVGTSVVTNASCSGGTGSATVSISNGSGGTYTYSWAAGQSTITNSTTQIINNLAVGNYTVTIIDGSCSSTSIVNITEPAAITLGTITPTSAGCGQNNGSAVTTIATGGTGTITYSWSNGNSGVTASGLLAQTYTLTVKDANNCSITTTVSINSTSGASISNLTKSDPLCNGGVGSATVNIAGGASGNYTYSWSNGASTITTATSNQELLTSNTYTVTVTDGSCSVTSTLVISEPLALSSGVTSTNASCGLANGTAIATPTGGNTGAYTYNWSNGFTTSTGSQINNLSAQTYSLTVTDSKGCTVTTAVTITTSAGINTSNGGIANALCFGTNTGSTTVNLSGGTTPYSYSWSTTITGTTSANKITLSNVGVGSYTITVTDANACSATYTAAITEPALLTSGLMAVNGSCNSGGSITATISGGTAAYTYSWSNGSTAITTSTSNQLTNLSTQNYTLTITDSNGCISTTTTNINNGVGVGITGTTSIAPNCFGENTGSASVSATAGATLYTYSWSNGVSTITSNSTAQNLNITAGIYTITITDNNLCTATTVVTITSPLQLTAQILTTNTTCGLNNGTLDIIPSGGDGNYSYSWSNAQTTQQINNVAANTYTVTLTDGKGCAASSSGIVGTSTAPLATINANPTSILEGGETSILTAGGGVTYQWKPSATLSCSTCQSPIALPLVTTTYTLIATDSNGCIDSTDIIITVKPACIGSEEDVYIANIFSPNGDGQNDVLFIKGNGLENINWAIYDRWGNKLFETNSQAQGWDGAFDGKALGVGTYVYYLKATCKKTNREIILKGNVSIVK